MPVPLKSDSLHPMAPTHCVGWAAVAAISRGSCRVPIHHACTHSCCSPLRPDKPCQLEGPVLQLGQPLPTVSTDALRAAAAFQANILHLDIKSCNVLLARDGTAKVADVGLARTMIRTVGTYASGVGTWAWASPEILSGRRCSKASDVFSFGEHMSLYLGKAYSQPPISMQLLPPVVSTDFTCLQVFCCGSWLQLSRPTGGGTGL